ncbi:MAG: YdeI/OmpD-associated family protein [Myxococcales bacterium]|jgi:uncharacterized protein YdeI (YjbR/CyaY-like superfamily)|nr:YdeI/OmpD-associated family protein [Myxococcales bacterium]MBL0198331.1 YdeI/OmpD-associated family protein [Myxococcales bacterium]HQY61898.1 YdeI/OmpD-associated family protein [Polyangiaceae bacterium]
MDPLVDRYFVTSKRWRAESARVRAVLLDCGLGEALKWGKPCYTHGGHNIAIVQPMNAFLALMFFKGALLDDPGGVLEEQGASSRYPRRVCFSDLERVTRLEPTLRDLVAKAIAVEDSGLTLPDRPAPALAPELQERLDREPALRAAFLALTPGRRREYDLHVAGAKQSSTRARRVDQHVARILAGKGLRDA